MQLPGFEFTEHDGVATVQIGLGRPKNAFRRDDALRLGELIGHAESRGARCLVLRGAGDTFCAGWDITSIDPAADDPMAVIGDVVAPLCQRLRRSPVPTVAAVAGAALGFGFGLAMCCDIVLADEQARLGSPFRGIGMVPDTGTHHFLLGRLGYGRAIELVYSGRLLTGREAPEAGLINRAVAASALAGEVDELARHIASGPTAAFALSKQILQQGGSLDEVMAAESRALVACFSTADLHEGLAAFAQKRRPHFTGR
jgi:enoyl-CoA hydratase/carnithine racemase